MKRIEAFARSDANIGSLGVLDIYYIIYIIHSNRKLRYETYFGKGKSWHKFKYTDYYVMKKAHK